MLSVIAFGIFLSMLLTLHACYALIRAIGARKSARRRFGERLGSWTQSQDAVSGRLVRKEVLSDVAWINELLKETAWLKRYLKLDYLRRLHDQSGTSQPLARYLLAAVTLAAAGFVLGTHFRLPAAIAVLIALTLGGTPLFVLYRMKSKRIAAFQRMLPEALDLIARALKAGHAFFVGVKIAGEELGDPVGGEFRRVYEDISVGLAVPEALNRLLGRVNCPDVKYFVTAVTVQRETGGNLAEIMENLGLTIRKRFEFHEKVRAISAEGVLSAIIVFALPFAMGLFEYTVSPDYMSMLWTDPIGKAMATAAAVMMIVGAFVTRRLIDVKV
ncbi:MAG TPA: type II secretion system F family protein [Nitrospira sp.]|nr:type II secretion system F family protein [Nitrospira sp.]